MLVDQPKGSGTRDLFSLGSRMGLNVASSAHMPPRAAPDNPGVAGVAIGQQQRAPRGSSSQFMDFARSNPNFSMFRSNISEAFRNRFANRAQPGARQQQGLLGPRGF